MAKRRTSGTCIHKLPIYSCDSCSPLADEPRSPRKPFVLPPQKVNLQRKPAEPKPSKPPVMASPEQIKTIRKLSGLSKKKKLKPITTERADEIIEALNWDEAVFVDLLDDKQIKLRPIYPQGRRRRKR